MKKWLRRWAVYGAILALAGCGVDNGKAVGPENSRKTNIVNKLLTSYLS